MSETGCQNTKVLANRSHFEMGKGIRSLVSDGAEELSQAKPTQEDEPDDANNSVQTRRWAGAFWTVIGILTVLVSLPVFGMQYEILFPALVLTGYGLFVLWNPPIAESDAPWTGVLWVTMGLMLLIVVRLFDLHWTVEVNGVIIGLFLVCIGLLVVLDL